MSKRIYKLYHCHTTRVGRLFEYFVNSYLFCKSPHSVTLAPWVDVKFVNFRGICGTIRPI